MSRPIQKIAVLGAGVMGAQIAALLATADYEILLFDLPSHEADSNAVIRKAVGNLTRLQPAPLSSPCKMQHIIPANYQDHLPLLKNCDWIIEAIAEKLDLKKSLFEMILPYLNDEVIFTTNTSGIGIHLLAEILPETLRNRFCGVHFFNPPRYMRLVEIIVHAGTKKKVTEKLESFLATQLGKGVVFAKDTPNFIANRIGVFGGILSPLKRAAEFGIPVEIVDQLTGPSIGRPKSATFRTIDVVGLDTLSHVIATMQTALQADPWHSLYQIPESINTLIREGFIGQKVGKGFYSKENKNILVYDFKSCAYVLASGKADPAILAILKIPDLKQKLSLLRNHGSAQAKFLWACFCDLFQYAAFHLKDIAYTVRDIDLSMRWGYGWATGPFELWQQAGWKDVADWINEDLAYKKTLAMAPLPQWVNALDNGPYTEEGSFSPENGVFIPRDTTGIYKRQLFQEPLLNERIDNGKTLLETDQFRLWECGGDNIGILSFKSKLGTMGPSVLEGICAAVSYAEQNLKGMVVWQSLGRYFSVGANLKEVMSFIENSNFASIETYIRKFQESTSAVRYAAVPVVAAIQGYALGGGCELMMHAARRVCVLDTQAGLVESQVGVIPAGCGTKEFVRRATLQANGDSLIRSRLLRKAFFMLFEGQSYNNAHLVQENNFLNEADIILFNPFELLYVAKQQVIALQESAYHPPLKVLIPAAGKPWKQAMLTELDKQMSEGKISEHDRILGGLLASVFAGGDAAEDQLLSEDDYLELEREAFSALIKTPKTQERIKHMLSTGVALKN